MKRGVCLIVAAMSVAACSTGGDFTAGVISTLHTVGTGQQRVLVELRDADGRPLDIDAVPEATLRNEDGSPLGVYPGELVWLVPDEVAAYSFVMEIPEPETYQVTVDGGELGETPPAGFVAVADPVQVEQGEPAPPIAGGPVAGPALLVFASLDSCPSRSCQPMIEQVEAVSSASGVPWSRVDVFTDPGSGSEDELELSPVVDEWGIPSQPWLYVVDGEGEVSALFEGAVSDEELAAAVREVTGSPG